MSWFLNHYHCESCNTSWTDEWSCCCNDKCLSCNTEIEPESSDELTVVVEKAPANDPDLRYVVMLSPNWAEHRDEPDYQAIMAYPTLPEAEAFAERLREVL